MGGNSPSHFSTEEWEGGGVTFVKGIRVSGSRGSRCMSLHGGLVHDQCGVGCRCDLQGLSLEAIYLVLSLSVKVFNTPKRLSNRSLDSLSFFF